MINFEKFIQINNKLIGTISISNLLKLNIETPDIQRIVDTDKVNDIVNYQINHIKKYKFFNFLGSINIHYVKNNDNYYLSDGQHRYSAATNYIKMDIILN